MKFKSQSGFSLIEIGIALIISAIFMVSSITLLSASNENYRRMEQRNIALSYAMKAIEATLLEEASIDFDSIKNEALNESNMRVDVNVEEVFSRDGSNKIEVVTANVQYHTKSSEGGDLQNLKLQTLKANN